MKKGIRIIIGIICICLLIIAWIVAVNSKSPVDKQLILVEQAVELMNNGIFIRAVPLLEEALEYETTHTITIENKLKVAYLELMDNRGITRKYIDLLEKQMSRHSADSDVFIETASYYLGINKIQDALEILKNGVEKTNCVNIISMYENNRYKYELGRSVFDNVTEIFEGTIGVFIDGKWGVSNIDGNVFIPCEYDKVSTFYRDRVIVQKNGSIFAVDRANNRIELAKPDVINFGNFSQGRISIRTINGWQRATGDFSRGTNIFEELGMYSNNYTAAKTNGKWGVIDIQTSWLLPAKHDEIIMDELGRSYAQNAVFVRDGDTVRLYADGKWLDEIYQDARPFSDVGYAAVKLYDKWGFIDTQGNVKIEFIYDDALSFGEHLAAVKIG
ncbi:MAG: WG repeat-containing protein, partial [Oscillospiraceae bacterium]|nr:WG repeat-containing protein [Oscillospiraceae bacterium]